TAVAASPPASSPGLSESTDPSIDAPASAPASPLVLPPPQPASTQAITTKRLIVRPLKRRRRATPRGAALRSRIRQGARASKPPRSGRGGGLARRRFRLGRVGSGRVGRVARRLLVARGGLDQRLARLEVDRLAAGERADLRGDGAVVRAS